MEPHFIKKAIRYFLILPLLFSIASAQLTDKEAARMIRQQWVDMQKADSLKKVKDSLRQDSINMVLQLAINNKANNTTVGGQATAIAALSNSKLDKPTADGLYLSKTTAFSQIATTGSYNDLLDRPAIPSIAGLLTSIDAANNYQPKGVQVTKLYNKSAALLSSAAVEVVDTFTYINSATAISLPLPPGTTAAKVKSVEPIRPGATINNVVFATITATGTSSVNVIVTQQNTATVAIGAINVLAGLPMILVPDPQNIKLKITYAAY